MSNEQLPNKDLTQKIDEALNYSPSPPRKHKYLKIILGIATILPILFYIIPSIKTLGVDSLNFSDLLLLTILLYPLLGLRFVLSLIYILIVFKNTKVSKIKKVFWIAIFSTWLFPFQVSIPTTSYSFISINQSFLGSLINILSVWLTPFIMLIYWYLHIWKEPKQNH